MASIGFYLSYLPVRQELPPLPSEILVKNIFTQFSEYELLQFARVCRLWKQCAYDASLWKDCDLEKKFKLKVFDETLWKTHQKNVDDLPPLNKRTLISEVCTFYSEMRRLKLTFEEDAGVSVYTIPKGLNLNEISEILKMTKTPAWAKFEIDPFALELWGKETTPLSYRFMLSPSIVKGTRRQVSMSFEELADQMGCTRPGILESSAILLHSASMGQSFPSRALHPDSFIRCHEEAVGGIVLIGGANRLESNIQGLQTSFLANTFRFVLGIVGETPMRIITD